MIDPLINRLKAEVGSATAPVLAWSGGRASTFLLHLMVELGLNFELLTFHHLWTRGQRQRVATLAAEKRLMVFSYPPVNVNYVYGTATVDYWVANKLVTVTMPHVRANNCGLDIGRAAVKESHLQPVYPWDLTVTGAAASSRNFTGFNGPGVTAPLWGWTLRDVLDAAAALGYKLPDDDTGNYVACMACMNGADRVYCPKVDQMIHGIGNDRVERRSDDGIRT